METAETTRWIATRTRPGEAAPSLSIGVIGKTPNLALIRFLERYPDQPIGTRVNLRFENTDWRDFSAQFTRGQHIWERTV